MRRAFSTAAAVLAAMALLAPIAQAQNPSPPPPPDPVRATLDQLLQETRAREGMNLLHANMLEAQLATARARIVDLETKLAACNAPQTPSSTAPNPPR